MIEHLEEHLAVAAVLTFWSCVLAALALASS